MVEEVEEIIISGCKIMEIFLKLTIHSLYFVFSHDFHFEERIPFKYNFISLLAGNLFHLNSRLG